MEPLASPPGLLPGKVRQGALSLCIDPVNKKESVTHVRRWCVSGSETPSACLRKNLDRRKIPNRFAQYHAAGLPFRAVKTGSFLKKSRRFLISFSRSPRATTAAVLPR